MIPFLRWFFALLVVGLAFLFCLHYALAFGVNVPYWDDWQLLDQARQVYSGHMHWWQLLINRHNEHLIGVAFLLESLQLLLTGFDYKLQLLTGVLIQGLSFALLAAVMWQYISKSRRPAWLAFSALIWFSLAQHKNLLWAFQTAWFLVSLFLAITLVCLRRASQMEDKQRGANAWLTGAVFAALLATFTSSQGILVWIAGAAYLLGCRSFKLEGLLRSALLRKWLISAFFAGCFAAYAWLKLGGWKDMPQGGKFSWLGFIYIFFGIHGDFWGDFGVHGLALLGVVMLCFVCLALGKVFLSNGRAAYALPVSLIAFGTSFVLLTDVGRAKFGIGTASDSHYTAYVVMTYFGVLSIFMRQDRTLPKFYSSGRIRFLYCAMIAFAFFTSSYNSVLSGIDWRMDQGMYVAILLKYRGEPDFMLKQTLFGDPEMVRRNADFLSAHKLGPFGDANAVPEEVKSYTVMPNSIEAMIVRYPEEKGAIIRAWQVYQVAGDLRRTFNPLPDQFARNLLNWCAGAAQPGSPYYLSQDLSPFAANYVAIRDSGLANKNTP